jgi:hypothetical protein
MLLLAVSRFETLRSVRTMIRILWYCALLQGIASSSNIGPKKTCKYNAKSLSILHLVSIPFQFGSGFPVHSQSHILLDSPLLF